MDGSVFFHPKKAIEPQSDGRWYYVGTEADVNPPGIADRNIDGCVVAAE